jgi:putative membrane protein
VISNVIDFYLPNLGYSVRNSGTLSNARRLHLDAHALAERMTMKMLELPTSRIVSTAILCLLASCGERDPQLSAEKRRDSVAPSIKSGNVTGELMNASVPAVPSAADFATAIAASDAFEIATSKLALSRSETAEVKAFAKRMVEEHARSTRQLAQAVAKTGSPPLPPVTLASDQVQAIEQLKSKRGTDFDNGYVNLQEQGHQRTLNVLKDYGEKGDAPALNEFAHMMIPIVSGHLTMIRNIMKRHTPMQP